MRITKNIYVAFASLLVAVGALVALNVTGTATQAVSSYRDCENDTIIKCGAVTQTELLQKYDSNTGDVQHIYSHYGISRSDIAGQTSEVKSGVVYQDGRVVVDGKTVATGAYSLARLPFYSKTGEAPRTIKINGTTLYEGPNMSIFVRPVDAYVFMRNGQFHGAVLSACGNPLMATPVTPPAPKPQPVYSCDSLQATKIDRTNFKFTSAATAKNGASIVSYTYNFGDNHTETTTSSSVNHTYSKPGTYTATLSVTIKVGATTKTITAEACKTTVKVEAVPVTPLYSCNSLTARIVKAETRTYGYTLNFTAEGGATLQKVVYNFGDNTSATFNKVTDVQHSYAKAGSYKTVATVYFNVKKGETTSVVSRTCTVTINISQEMCTVPGKENLPKNSPQCAETPITPQTPPTLPQTGMEDLLSGGLGLSSITAAGYYFVNSRKSLIDALLKR
jgi:hypothetical protein